MKQARESSLHVGDQEIWAERRGCGGLTVAGEKDLGDAQKAALLMECSELLRARFWLAGVWDARVALTSEGRGEEAHL